MIPLKTVDVIFEDNINGNSYRLLKWFYRELQLMMKEKAVRAGHPGTRFGPAGVPEGCAAVLVKGKLIKGYL